MVSLLFVMVFLMLFINLFNWNIIMLLIMLIFMYMYSFFKMYNYYGMLSYIWGGDVLSFSLIMLSTWIIFLMFMASSLLYSSNMYIYEYMFVSILLLFFLVLSFSVSNLFFYYLFFECSLIPTLILIFGWGYQPERLMAGYYLIFYTLFFSLPMLIGIFYINFSCFSMFYFMIKINFNFYLWFSMMMAFLVKMPMVFMHFWLPKAHVEAPISGSMILAGVLLKLGGYGIMRVLVFIPYNKYNMYLLVLSLFGIMIISLICMFQFDIKSLIAYSSVAHMGMVICALMSINTLGLIGSLILMIGHGLCSSGMFCLANIVYERTSSRSMFLNKGMLTLMPNMCMFWFILMSNNMSSPPSLNLLGEILLLNSIISWSSLSMFYLMFGSFMCCLYSIYLYSSVNHGLPSGGLKIGFYGYFIEYYLLFLHILPLNIFFLHSDLVSLMV